MIDAGGVQDFWTPYAAAVGRHGGVVRGASPPGGPAGALPIRLKILGGTGAGMLHTT